jgi:hypothetical protein
MVPNLIFTISNQHNKNVHERSGVVTNSRWYVASLVVHVCESPFSHQDIFDGPNLNSGKYQLDLSGMSPMSTQISI